MELKFMELEFQNTTIGLQIYYIYIYIIFSLLELDCPKIEFQNKGISLISLRNGAKC